MKIEIDAKELYTILNDRLKHDGRERMRNFLNNCMDRYPFHTVSFDTNKPNCQFDVPLFIHDKNETDITHQVCFDGNLIIPYRFLFEDK